MRQIRAQSGRGAFHRRARHQAFCRHRGLTWPPDPVLIDAELERRLYRGPTHTGAPKAGIRPNYAEVVKQLARKGVTRRLL
jgi:transposase